MEETGVNVAYMAFGFIRWKERDESAYVFRAPVLLAPVTFRCFGKCKSIYGNRRFSAIH